MVIQIKIHPLLDSLNEATFLRDLLHAYGITDVDAYLNPDSIEYQSPDMYKCNMMDVPYEQAMKLWESRVKI